MLGCRRGRLMLVDRTREMSSLAVWLSCRCAAALSLASHQLEGEMSRRGDLSSVSVSLPAAYGCSLSHFASCRLGVGFFAGVGLHVGSADCLSCAVPRQTISVRSASLASSLLRGSSFVRTLLFCPLGHHSSRLSVDSSRSPLDYDRPPRVTFDSLASSLQLVFIAPCRLVDVVLPSCVCFFCGCCE